MDCAVLRNTDRKSKAQEETAAVTALLCLWLSSHQNLRLLHIGSQASVKSHTQNTVPEELWPLPLALVPCL